MGNRKAEVTVATRLSIGFGIILAMMLVLSVLSIFKGRTVDAITTASDEQRAGIEEVNRAISQMDQVTQQNAVLVDHAAEVVETLQHQASHLNHAVGVFKTERGPSRPAHSMAADPKRGADVPALLAEPEGA